MADAVDLVRRSLLTDRALLALTATAFVLANATIVYLGWLGDFGFDFSCCYQQAGQRIGTDPSTLYQWSADYTFRYSPWAALAFRPLAGLTADEALWAWFGLKVAVLIGLAVAFSRPWHGPSRWWVLAAVLAFPPIWHDLMIGNVSVFTVAVLLVLLRSDRGVGGALLGLLLLLAPKPHLVAVALWLVIRRPRDAVAGLAVLLIGLLAGIVIWGPELWLDYARTFLEPLERTFTANIGFSGLLGPVGVAVGLAAGIAVGVLALRRGDGIGLGLSLVAGLLASPYLFIHYLAGLIVAVEPVLRTRPRRLAVYPWLLVAFPLIPAGLLGLAATLHLTPAESSDRRPPSP